MGLSESSILMRGSRVHFARQIGALRFAPVRAPAQKYQAFIRICPVVAAGVRAPKFFELLAMIVMRKSFFIDNDNLLIPCRSGRKSGLRVTRSEQNGSRNFVR